MRKIFQMCLLAGLALAPAAAAPIGIFEGETDVGSVVPAGTASYDAASDAYTITSAGANAWYRVDAFHFLWTKTSGDLSLTAEVSFPPTAYGHPPNPHRKAMLMVRQSLDAGSAYADAAQHGSGLTALQYRRELGANTQDVELNIAAPAKLQLVKRGDKFTLYLSTHGEPLHQVGATTTLHIDGPFYVGLGVTAHDADTADKIVFRHVQLTPLAPEAPVKTAVHTTLQTLLIPDHARIATVILSKKGVFESPNWMPDGKALLINEDGKFWKIPLLDPLAGGTPVPFDTGKASGCWGEHGFSPDGKWLAISCSTPHHKGPDVYVVPAEGGKARQVTHHPVSFFHGWSPDGKTIVFTSIRDSHEDIYTVPASGGDETRLTDTGLNDSGEYTPDGQFIYFNSNRTGSMQLWRMHPDGSGQEQVTADDHDNWYPHVSPDGKSIVFLSYAHGVGTNGHPENQDVTLRLLTPADGLIRTLVPLTGGQGTIDSPCWAPDSQHLAFASNQLLPDPQ